MPDVVYTFSAVNQQDVLNAYSSIRRSAEVTTNKQNQLAMKNMAIQNEVERRRIASEEKFARAAVNAAEAKVRAEKRAAAASVAAAEKERIKKLSLYQRSILMVKRLGNAAVAAAKREELALRRVNRERAKGNNLGRIRSFSGGTGLIGAGATAAMFGGMVVGAAGRKALSTDEAITQLAIKGRRPGQRINTKALKDKIYGSAIAAGIDPAELTKALRGYVGKTGDLPTASKFTDVFAKYISLGTGGEDIGKGAAFLGMKFGKGKGKNILTAAGMDQSLASLAVGGKRYQFELPDFAKQMPKIASAMKRFNFDNTGFGAVSQMGAWAQLAAQGTSGGAQAGTALENIFADLLGNNAKVVKDLGIKMKTKGGKMRNFEDIILDVLSAVGGEVIGKGDKKKGDLKLGLTDIFKRRSIRGMSAIAGKFAGFKDEGVAKGMGHEEAMQYARDEMRKFMNTMRDTSGAVSETNRDAALAQQSASNRIKAAWAAIEAAAMEELVPAIGGIAGELPKLVDVARVLMVAFKALGSAVMALVSLLPSSTETKIATVKAKRARNEQEMSELTERMRLHSTGKVRMSESEQAAVAGRLNQLSDETYGKGGGRRQGESREAFEARKKTEEYGGLGAKERILNQQLLEEKVGIMTLKDGTKVSATSPQLTKGQAEEVNEQVHGLDAYDAITMASAINPVTAVMASPVSAANMYDRIKNTLGFGKGALAREEDFVSLPGRASAAQKTVAARKVADVDGEVTAIKKSGQDLAKAIQTATAAVGEAAPSAHPTKPGKQGAK